MFLFLFIRDKITHRSWNEIAMKCFILAKKCFLLEIILYLYGESYHKHMIMQDENMRYQNSIKR